MLIPLSLVHHQGCFITTNDTFFLCQITNQAHMYTSHVVHEACMRGCSVESYRGPQGPSKLLDDRDFGLHGSTKVQAHYLEFAHMGKQMRYFLVPLYYQLEVSQFRCSLLLVGNKLFATFPFIHRKQLV